MKGRPLQSPQIVLLHLPLVPFPSWGWNLSTARGPVIAQPRAALPLHTRVWAHTGTQGRAGSSQAQP